MQSQKVGIYNTQSWSLPPLPLSWPLKTCVIMPVHDNAKPASLTLLPQVEHPALLEHFQWLWVATDRTLASSGPAEASASGQCEVQFRLTGPMWFQLWSMVGFSSGRGKTGLLLT